MGNLCSKPNYEENELFTTFLNIKEYTAKSDDLFNKFLQKYNILRLIDLTEYIILLNKHSGLNILRGEMTENSLVCYIDNCLFTHNALSCDYKVRKYFKDFIKNMYKLLLIANQIYNKQKCLIAEKTLKFIVLFTVGIIYCQSDLQTRLDHIFNYLSIDNKFNKSDIIHLFFFYLFIIPTLISIESIVEIQNKSQEEIFVSERLYKEIIIKFSIKNIFNLTEIFVKNFFYESESYDVNNFVKIITNDEFSWILTQSGIRYYLEKYNFS